MFNLFYEEQDEHRGGGDAYKQRHRRRIEPLHKNLRPESESAPRPAAIEQSTPSAAVVSVDFAAPEAPSKPKKPLEHLTNPAVRLIRTKLAALYSAEPAAKAELQHIGTEQPPARTKHQQFMYDLSTSGRSLAEIQTAWHAYYVGLPDTEKHEVWQEFYDANSRQPTAYSQFVTQHTGKPAGSSGKKALPTKPLPELPHRPRRQNPRLIKQRILSQVSEQTRAQAKHHLKSLVFGLSTGALVLAIFLFSFFNEVIIAPFIQPSRTANATPIILSSDGVAPSDRDEVIIPKINVEIPLDFSVSSTDETGIENALENGVVHYPTTVRPGEQGNTAYFGHSSNNIFNKGKYKFAFVLLRTLQPGDIFYLTSGGKVYSYRVFDKRVVEPTETSVLNPVAGKTATATLITCDPPGTSLHRLVVWGEQVSPDPSGNIAAQAPTVTGQPKALPSNGPTLWGRFVHWLSN